MQLPTIKVHAPESDCGWKIINQSDFDKEVHTPFDEDEPRAAEAPKQGAKQPAPKQAK
jgi:hypothetical protein